MKDGEYRQAIYNWQELSPHQYEVMADLTRAAFSEYARDNNHIRECGDKHSLPCGSFLHISVRSAEENYWNFQAPCGILQAA